MYSLFVSLSWQSVVISYLKVLLGHLEVLPRARRLPDGRVHDT